MSYWRDSFPTRRPEKDDIAALSEGASRQMNLDARIEDMTSWT